MLRILPILNQCLRHKSTHSFNRRKDLLLEIKGDLIYGVHPVYLALRAEKRTFNKIFYNRGSSKAAELAEMAETRNIPAVQLSRENLDELTRKVSRYKDHHVHQGIVADVSRMHHIPIDYEVPQIPELKFEYSQIEDDKLILLLYGIKDPMNLGALLRSAFYFGVSSIIVAGDRTDLTAVVSKASVGSLELLRIYALRNPVEYLNWMKEQGWNLMALSLPNQHIQNYCTLDQVRLKEKNVLVIGNEGEGIPDPLLQIVDQGLFIKSGKGVTQDEYVDSLNVSVATGITLQALLNNNNSISENYNNNNISENNNNNNNDDNNNNSANNIR